MNDLISRADAIDAVAEEWLSEASAESPYVNDNDIDRYRELAEELFADIPSAETHEIRTETHGVCLISKDDAMGAVQDHFNANGFKGYDDGQKMMDKIKALPSAEAESDDLIIKGAKGIKDGLYNITDGKLYKYKAKGGTVRTYPIVPSADRPQGEWVDREVFNETDDDHIVEEWQSARCSVCGKYHTTPYMYYFDDFNYCPNCGARMEATK